jgi:hypothetical protein
MEYTKLKYINEYQNESINPSLLLPNHNDWKMLIKMSHYCLI